MMQDWADSGQPELSGLKEGTSVERVEHEDQAAEEDSRSLRHSFKSFFVTRTNGLPSALNCLAASSKARRIGSSSGFR